MSDSGLVIESSSELEPEQTARRLGLPRIRMMGIELDAVNESEAVNVILNELDAGKGGWGVTVNTDILRQMVRDSSARRLLGPVNLFVADGAPIVWAASIAGTPLPERVCGSNLIHSLTKAAARRGKTVFFLGGDEGTAESAAQTLQQRHNGLRVAGWHCPPHGFERDEQLISDLQFALKRASPDIVYVALGFPKQERLIDRLREDFPCTWWLGVGISFSFVCGHVRRAPGWMQMLGMEWVHRLLQEPRRLAGRYLVRDAPFALRLMCRALLHRVRWVTW